MVGQGSLHPTNSHQQTLADIWRAATRRTSERMGWTYLVVGALAVVAFVLIASAKLAAPLFFIVGAFGLATLASKPTIAGRTVHDRLRRTLGLAAALVASVSAVFTALWLLALVFGGSLEVMRR